MSVEKVTDLDAIRARVADDLADLAEYLSPLSPTRQDRADLLVLLDEARALVARNQDQWEKAHTNGITMKNEAIFDVVMRACAQQAQNPERFGGGIIGRAAAVVDALGINGDLPMSSLAQKKPRAAASPPERQEPT